MKNIQKLGAYLPETYQYFPIFTDIFTYNDTAFDLSVSYTHLNFMASWI